MERRPTLNKNQHLINIPIFPSTVWDTIETSLSQYSLWPQNNLSFALLTGCISGIWHLIVFYCPFFFLVLVRHFLHGLNGGSKYQIVLKCDCEHDPALTYCINNYLSLEWLSILFPHTHSPNSLYISPYRKGFPPPSSCYPFTLIYYSS